MSFFWSKQKAYIAHTSSRHFESILTSSTCVKSHLPQVENRV